VNGFFAVDWSMLFRRWTSSVLANFRGLLQAILVAGVLFVRAHAEDKKADGPAATLREKAEHMIYPSVNFRDASVEECLEYIRMASRADVDPPKPGVNLVLKMSPAQLDKVKLDMDLRDVSLSDFLNRVAALAGAEVVYEPNAVLIREKGLPPLAPVPDPAKSEVAKKAASLTLRSVEFGGATIEEGLEYFRMKSREVDPAKVGVKMMANPELRKGEVTVSLDLRNISLMDALHYFADQANLELTVDKEQLVLVSGK
jgi:hypothetical protein